MYESAAAGAHEREQRNLVGDHEQRLAAEWDALWQLYQRKLVEMFDATADETELAQLEEEARDELRRELGEKPAFIAGAYQRARVRDLKLARMNIMSEREFRAHASASVVRVALANRQGVELLKDADTSGGDNKAA